MTTTPDDALAQVIVDSLDAAAEGLSDDSTGWTSFEHATSIFDLAGLSAGQDCYYDRPSIGLQYALWYHPQRTVDLIKILQPVVAKAAATSGHLDVIDLGAGTGATATAVRTAVARLRLMREDTPQVRIVGIESSPFMIDALALIDAQVAERTGTAGDVTVEAVQRSWFSPRLPDLPRLKSPHLVASYTFDHSDVALNETLVDRLRRLGDEVNAESLTVLGPRAKIRILERVARGLAEDQPDSSPWQQRDVAFATFRANVPLRSLGDRRRALGWDVDRAQPLLRSDPSWINPGLWSAHFDRVQTSLLPPEPTPFGFTLDERQDSAANPDAEGAPRPTVIVGAAGSGKSYVLAERAARTLDDPHARVLVTAFNKLMVDELARILGKRLGDATDLVQQNSGFWFDREGGAVAQTSRLVLCNRDKLPTRLFDMRFNGQASASDPEAERFIWGKGLFDRDAYMAAERRGAGTPLQPAVRQKIWGEFWREGNKTFTHRRIATLRAVRARQGGQLQRFTHVFIDECQDFTESDFELVRYLVDDPGTVVAAGDEAQSLHLGGTYKRPTLHRNDGSATRWRVHQLQGAYRMSVAACRAVAPLATHLREHVTGLGSACEDLTVPEPRKAGSYGPRPIVLHADDVAELPRLLRTYSRFTGSGSVTVTDGGSLRLQVISTLQGDGFTVAQENMRLIKGLERPNVIVLAEPAQGQDGETATQRFYTAITRSTGVIVLVLPSGPPGELLPALRAVAPALLMPWNERAHDLLDDLGVGE